MGTWTESHGKPWILWTLNREEFSRWRSRPLRVDATVYATLFGNARTARFHFGETGKPNPPWGVCGAGDRGGAVMVWCRGAYSPALWTRVKLRDRETGKYSSPVWLSSANYAPFHVDPGISPLNVYLSRFTLPALHREEENSWNSSRLGVTDVEFNGLEPLDHVIRPVRFDSVSLEDFEVIEPR